MPPHGQRSALGAGPTTLGADLHDAVSAMPRLSFRRQLLLLDATAAAPADVSSWQEERIGAYRLFTHPDATVAVAWRGATCVVIVGVALDPRQPERPEADLARDLATAPPDDRQDLVDGWTGAFAAVRCEGDDAEIHHDAAGLTAIVWTTDGPLAVGSDPALLARAVPLVEAPEAPSFEASRAYANAGRLWPGTRTRYRNVRRLLPNHILTLPDRASRRIFPVRPLPARTIGAGADALAKTARGGVLGVAARRPVRLGLTAGWDSRVLLAASRPLVASGQLSAYVIVHPIDGGRAIADTVDAEIANRLGRRLGFAVDTIRYAPRVDATLASALAESVTGGQPNSALMSRAFLDRSTAINGNVSEVARTYYARAAHPTAEVLAWHVYRTPHPVAVEAYGAWLAEAAPVSRALGYDIEDLFYWENRMGVWGATAWTGYRVACEMVSPFSNRRLLETLLGVPARFRGREHNPLYREAIARLWPEALGVPLNPQARTRAIRWMERAGVYGAYARLRDRVARRRAVR